MVCGIFLDQVSNPCRLHRQADSLPLSHQGSPLRFLGFICLSTLGKIIKSGYSIYFDEFESFYGENSVEMTPPALLSNWASVRVSLQ